MIYDWDLETGQLPFNHAAANRVVRQTSQYLFPNAFDVVGIKSKTYRAYKQVMQPKQRQ